MIVKIINVRIGDEGIAVGDLINLHNNETLMIADIKTLVNYIHHQHYLFANQQEVIESIGKNLGDKMTAWLKQPLRSQS